MRILKGDVKIDNNVAHLAAKYLKYLVQELDSDPKAINCGKTYKEAEAKAHNRLTKAHSQL